MRKAAFLIVALLALSASATAQAALMIDIQSISGFQAGGSGQIEIYLTPDTDTNLSGFAFELSINQPYGNDSLLEFADFVGLPTYHSDSTYVFYLATSGPAGNSGGSPATTWIGFDLADSAVALAKDSKYLLARLNLKHSSLPSPYDPNGQEFHVQLVVDQDTYYLDEVFSPIEDIASNTGMITIAAGTAVVPEPSSFCLVAGLSIAAAFWRRRTKCLTLQAGISAKKHVHR